MSEASENRISRKAAEEQLKAFLDYYEIDKNDIVVDQGPEAIETIYNRVVRAIERGQLEVDHDENGTIRVTQILKKPVREEVVKLVYAELAGRHKLEMDKAGDKGGTKRMHALVAALTKQPSKVISELSGVDLSIAERLATLFMVI